MGVERSELELVWPAGLFAHEAQALLDAGYDEPESLGYLLDEAFHGGRGLQLFNQVDQQSGAAFTRFLADDRRTPATTEPSAPERLVLDLVRDVGKLRRYERPLYYSARRRNPTPEPVLTLAEAKAAYAVVVGQLAQAGYFEDAFGSTCVDARGVDPDREGQHKLSQLLDTDLPMWPLESGGDQTGLEQNWPEELFYDVAEALHDQVARPRRRHWHPYGEEWDYSDYARIPGRAVYRWKVNELLDRSEIPLRLADSGSDQGRLVHATGDPRDDLVARALLTPDPDVRAEVEHAVAMFRGRGGSREDKRSAVVALARVLEDRRDLLHNELGKKDEGALFHIANEFDLRHRGVRGRGREQQGDYDPAFLNWIFWWYLATVELTDRLLARQES